MTSPWVTNMPITLRGEAPKVRRIAISVRLSVNHHDEHGHDVERGHGDDEEQNERHHRLLDAHRTKVSRVVHRPVNDFEARRQERAHPCGHARRRPYVAAADPQALRRLYGRGQRPHVINVRKHERRVVILESRPRRFPHREFPQRRCRSARRVDDGDEHGHRIAEDEAEPLRDDRPTMTRLLPRCQIIEMPFGDGTPDVIDLALGLGINPRSNNRQHLRSAYRQSLQLNIGSDADDFGTALTMRRTRWPVLRRGCTCRSCGRQRPRMCAEREQPIAQHHPQSRS